MKLCSDVNHYISAINNYFQIKSFRKITVLENCFSTFFTKIFNIQQARNSNEVSGAYLGPSQTSTMERFRRNS